MDKTRCLVLRAESRPRRARRVMTMRQWDGPYAGGVLQEPWDEVNPSVWGERRGSQGQHHFSQTLGKVTTQREQYQQRDKGIVCKEQKETCSLGIRGEAI